MPLILLGITEFYVRGYDGWGAWAAAPILLVPGIISLAIVIWGLYECAAEIRHGKLSQAAPVYTLLRLGCGFPAFGICIWRYSGRPVFVSGRMRRLE
jgi:hypothetical protein